MYMNILLTGLLLFSKESNGHKINKEKCVRDVADKVATLITTTTSQCIITPTEGLDDHDRPSDCGDLKKSEYKSGHGVYKIFPDGTSGFHVFCDMETDKGGWTVFQRRTNNYVGFYREWESYKNGFGNLKSDFWLGNEYLNKITEQGYYILRIDMEDFENNHKYAIYEKFAVENEKSGYKLKVAGYTGNAGDSFSGHNGYKFTTRDRDNDAYPHNCAELYYGGWWYTNCHYSNLNGMYLMGKHSSYAIGVNWKTWKGYNYSLKTTRMMIRRA